jgi:hypothetical protein
VNKVQKLHPVDEILGLAICASLAAFIVWFQFTSMREAAFNIVVGDINWTVILYVAVLGAATIIYILISDWLPRYVRVLFALLIAGGTLWLCVSAFRIP